MMLRSFLSILISLASIVACSKPSTSADTPLLGSCENSIVVTDYHSIRLFEASTTNQTFVERWANSTPWMNFQANIVCKHNKIVATYLGYGPNLEQGIAVYDIRRREWKNFSLNDGAGYFVPHDNGILFQTTLLHKKPIDPNIGFVSTRERALGGEPNQSFSLDPKESGFGTDHVFSWLHQYDLTEGKITRSFRDPGGPKFWLSNDTSITILGPALMDIDLSSGRRTSLFEFDKSPVHGVLYSDFQIARVGDTTYAVTAPSHNNERRTGMPPEGGMKLAPSAIYVLANNVWTKLDKLPFEDPAYVMEHENALYIFSRDGDFVYRYDTLRKTGEKIHIEIDHLSVEAASYSDRNFIILARSEVRSAPGRPADRNGYLYLFDKDLKRIGGRHDLGPIAAVSITTVQQPVAAKAERNGLRDIRQ